MCHNSCIKFGIDVLTSADVLEKRVLEVGALNVNGSLRGIVTGMNPSEYLGVDVQSGDGVDELCAAERIVERFGKNRWDLIICTEVLEHVWDWQAVVSSLKIALAQEGRLVVTKRAVGFHYHPYPYDLWRFDLADMAKVFGDLKILRLQSDPQEPGVFLYAAKPRVFVEAVLQEVGVYSMLTKARMTHASPLALRTFLADIHKQITWLQTIEQSHRELLEDVESQTQ
jgi:SAM-dependent methyltransferase